MRKKQLPSFSFHLFRFLALTCLPVSRIQTLERSIWQCAQRALAWMRATTQLTHSPSSSLQPASLLEQLFSGSFIHAFLPMKQPVEKQPAFKRATLLKHSSSFSTCVFSTLKNEQKMAAKARCNSILVNHHQSVMSNQHWMSVVNNNARLARRSGGGKYEYE